MKERQAKSKMASGRVSQFCRRTSRPSQFEATQANSRQPKPSAFLINPFREMTQTPITEVEHRRRAPEQGLVS
jgi:hypothetical protein